MNLEDAKTVLAWLGYEQEAVKWWRHPETNDIIRFGTQSRWRLDASWIFAKLVPTLEERLRVKTFTAVHHMDGFWMVELQLEHEATGLTFEAAMISAAAKAVRNAER